MSPIVALLLTGFTEARRNRVTVVIGAFAGVMILMTTVFLNTTAFTLDRAVTDFGLGVMNWLLVALSVYLSVGMLSREIEKRTVFLVVSRPISREAFVVGRYLGIGLTLTAMLVPMGALYVSQVVLFEVDLTKAMFASLVGLWAELWVLAAMGVFFSSFSGQLVSGISVVGLYFVGHLSPELYWLSDKLSATSPVVSAVLKAGYYVLPNLDRLDFRPLAAVAGDVSWIDVGTSVAWSGVWSVIFVTLATLAFRSRDFK
jgi:ABC-type transport system involved in multi-copper enzyme maturation permease subunit